MPKTILIVYVKYFRDRRLPPLHFGALPEGWIQDSNGLWMGGFNNRAWASYEFTGPIETLYEMRQQLAGIMKDVKQTGRIAEYRLSNNMTSVLATLT
jgi:hypothetical protein